MSSLIAQKNCGVRGMSSLIPTMNQLQDILVGMDMCGNELPEIVVIGDQNSGKSSLMESLVGKNFIPRGDGIIIRRPIILRLLYTSSIEQSEDGQDLMEWCEFGHCPPGERWGDFHAVSQEVLKETKQIRGHPLMMTFFSPHVVTLTVVNLPECLQTRSDHPEDMELNNLIQMYIKRLTTFIIVVAPAPTAETLTLTSESLDMARTHDPTGKRTLLVLTKLNEGDQKICGDYLSGQVHPVGFGCMGVMNRTEEEVKGGMTVQQGKLNEMTFIWENFKDCDWSHRNGTNFLAHRISRLLQSCIQNYLPRLEKQVSQWTKETKKTLDKLGESEIKDIPETMTRVLTKFSEKFASQIKGTGSRTVNIDIWGLSFKGRVKEIIAETFTVKIDSVDPLKDTTDDQINNKILEFKSTSESQLSALQTTYMHFVREKIQALKAPCALCNHSVIDEMKNLIDLCFGEGDDNVIHFPKLNDSIMTIMKKSLNQKRKKVCEYLEAHLDIQHAVMKSRKDLLHDLEVLILKSTETEVEIVKKFICKSFDIIRESLKEIYPHTVHNIMITHFSRRINVFNALRGVLSKDPNIEKLMEVSPEIVSKIKEMEQKLNRLVAAKKIFDALHRDAQF